MMPRFPAVLASALALTACVAQDAAAPLADACHARPLQALVGQPEAAAAPYAKGDTPVRILHPGKPMTMDYREDRLNILIDKTGKVEKVFCG